MELCCLSISLLLCIVVVHIAWPFLAAGMLQDPKTAVEVRKDPMITAKVRKDPKDQGSAETIWKIPRSQKLGEFIQRASTTTTMQVVYTTTIWAEAETCKGYSEPKAGKSVLQSLSDRLTSLHHVACMRS